MKRAPYRTALFGFGAIAQGLSADRKMARHFPFATHAQVLEAHPAFNWVATVEIDPVARRRAAERSGGIVAADVDAAISACAPEIVVLAIPPGARLAALRKLPGLKAVIVEKPLGRNLAEARRFVAYCAARKIAVQVCYWRRAESLFAKLAANRARVLGPMQAGFGLYGNGLRNNGSHLVDFVTMQAGRIVGVRAFGPAQKLSAPPIAGDVAVAAALRLENGAHVAIQPVDFAHYREVALDLWGARARRVFDQESLRVADFPLRANRGLDGAFEIASDRPATYPPLSGRSFYRLYDNLARGLVGREKLCSSGQAALEVERIVDAILRSASAGGRDVAIAR